MMRLLKEFWRSLVFLTLLIGLLFLASDIGDIPEAVRDWRDVLVMIDISTALWIFSIAAFGYIVWIDARPAIGRWRKGERREVSAFRMLQWRSGAGDFVDGEPWYVNECYLLVYNDGRSGRTARNVRVNKYFLGDREEAKELCGKTTVDLHNGEQALFHIGRIVMRRMAGPVDFNLEADKTDIAHARHNLPNGNFAFRWKENMGLMFECSKAESNILRHLIVRVSAQDIPTITVKMHFSCAALQRTGWDDEPPISIEDISQV